jgi:hypothetical protein
MPVTVVNNAAKSANFATYLAGSYRGNASITFTVPAFEHTVGGQKYTLKSYIVSRGNYTIPAIYNSTGTYSQDASCDAFMTIRSPNSAENIATNASLSAVLGTPAMRNKLLSDANNSVFGPPGSPSGLFMSLSAGLGYFQKSVFYTNPMRVDGQWGYPMDSTQESSQYLVAQFATGRYPMGTPADGVTFMYDMLSGTNIKYGTNNNYLLAVSAVKYTYNTLGISKFTICESLTSQVGNVKYHTVRVPIDSTQEKLLISYYAK